MTNTSNAILIQFITVQWSKASRGAPGAALRNAVAETFPLSFEILSGNPGVHLQNIRLSESQQFQDPVTSLQTHLNTAGLSKLNLHIEKANSQCRIFYWGDIKRPIYPKIKHAFSLLPGEYGQIISNGRDPVEDTWHYEKHIYNIYFGQSSISESHFLENAPDRYYKDEVNLF